ncbi:glucokinase [Halosimplex carlsbadense 2-9-1]|uniref:Glucokinase n=1 Tax=Halosimplex carlsbadense 2-9-1 TaxID=797114 RepID=M0CLU2_9EURY|nr:ROK family protein [Halosimplex carlsbadense]ELZ24245.1 glucokinase [Halosimplex carlsbadense 2-9-1]
MATYAGVDLGATNIRAVVGDETGRVVASRRTGTPQGPNGITVTEAVLDALRGAADEADVDPTRIAAVGIGSIGPLDLAEGAIDNPANLPDTIDRIPLTGPVGELVDSDDIYLHNDTTAGVIGERFYSDRNPDDMIYLTISSGIGAGVCVDGEVVGGWDGNAGEVGHMTVDPQGFMTCGCGIDGHWEAYCSGNNIFRYAQELHDRDPVETSMPLESADFSSADVFAHAEEGDDFAEYVLDQMTQWNVVATANMIHAFAPLVIYVGGAVTLNNPDRILDPIRERLDAVVFGNVPDVQLTTLGDDVVVKGALASAMTAGTGDRSRVRSA